MKKYKVDKVNNEIDNDPTTIRPVIKQTWFQSIKKPFYGFIFAMISSVLDVTCNLLQKKTKFFNEFDNAMICFFFKFYFYH